MTSVDLVERRTQEIGRGLLASARSEHGGLFSTRFWSDLLMDWSLKDPRFKVQMFRFVDAYPSLQSAEAVRDCLIDYMSLPGVTIPPGMGLVLRASGAARTIFGKTVGNRIEALAERFIAGTDPAKAMGKLETLWRRGVAASVDLLGEACLSREDADRYRQRYLELIGTLGGSTTAWPERKAIENDHLGPVPRGNVSIKLSSLDPRLDPADFSGTVQRLEDALLPLLEAARDANVAINFDMEQHGLKELTLEVFERCAEKVAFSAGIALQAYLRSAEDDARRLIAWARRSGRRVTVRLIKGAYWDYEIVHAEQMGWPLPVWTKKAATDACFERVAEIILTSTPRARGEGGVCLAAGSHNLRSIARILALLEHHNLPREAVEFQMLYGMAAEVKAAALAEKLRLREYVPLGEMIPGMAYLVRRLLENTSNESWLRAGFSEQLDPMQLLASPHRATSATEQAEDSFLNRAARRHDLSPAVESLGTGQPFLNEPLRDFADRDQREPFARAIQAAAAPGVHVQTDPSAVEEAVARAAEAFPRWRQRDPLERAGIVVRAALRMRRRRDELAAIVVRESGKTWREADADVCEAIDFCEYYARLAVELFQPKRLGRFVAERNEAWYEPRGVAAVISPWNFPLAIATGMTAAALVTGNTAVLKPASQTPGAARAMCEEMHSAGVPEDVLQLLVGPGGTIGDALVRHPRVALIAFTGSKQVGLEILKSAGCVPEGQRLVKKVVCEMGGKNAIIIDESADLDEAVAGVRQSAFGYAGQKCSACSRAIVVGVVHDRFLRRLVEAARSLVIGDPADPATDIGPVIDEAAAARIRQYIAIGEREGTLELACPVPAAVEGKLGKPLIGPHIFSGILPEHRLANEEVFGPVLAVMKAASFDEALEWANQTSYKLTGGVFSRMPSHLEKAKREFRVGNLYLNRGITGALVGRQPFGGFGLSGTGTKAGGADYLLHFVEPRCSTENTIRHGFAPGVEDWQG